MDDFDQLPPNPTLLSPQVKTFRGRTLAPYSFGRRLIARVVLNKDLDPLPQVWTLAVIYVVSLTEDEAREALFQTERFKANFFKWIETFDPADYKTALDLATAITDEAKAAEVRTVDNAGDGMPQKKNLAPSQEVWVCGVIGRDWHVDPEVIFWRWPICKCWMLMHVYFYANNVTCEAPLATDGVLDDLAQLYAHDHR